MKKLVFAFFTVVLISGIGGFFFFGLGPLSSSFPKKPEDTAPQILDFSFHDYFDKVLTPRDFQEKPLLITTWASWCSFCGRALLDFTALQNEFGDRITIIAVNRGEDPAKAKSFSSAFASGTPPILFALDPSDSFYKKINGFSLPETLFIDKKGKIQAHRRGLMDREELRRRINDLLATP